MISPEGSILALKQVRYDSDPSLPEAVKNEIDLMYRCKDGGLTGQNGVIIELVDAEVKLQEQMVLMVMECGDIDLAHLLQRQKGKGFNEHFICNVWQQMIGHYIFMSNLALQASGLPHTPLVEI